MAGQLDKRYALLGATIRRVREDKNLTQRELAGMIGQPSSNSYVYRLENGKMKVSLEQLIRIADALEVEVRDLIDF
ncbi:helix-turn-helix domain-containing protein [Eggerthella timonensis]|uniref:helix-turn-helix domain-containing protein n=1 Tax=Eggerthella timonensis TaxID=1871008 RepID=UPI000C75C435|nr:helix-turn-helix transcriptional regulator [Eggerthella timonensis]